MKFHPKSKGQTSGSSSGVIMTCLNVMSAYIYSVSIAVLRGCDKSTIILL